MWFPILVGGALLLYWIRQSDENSGNAPVPAVAQNDFEAAAGANAPLVPTSRYWIRQAALTASAAPVAQNDFEAAAGADAPLVPTSQVSGWSRRGQTLSKQRSRKALFY